MTTTAVFSPDWLKRQLEMRNMSQSEFARRGRVSVSQVSYFLSGDRKAGEVLYRAAADALDIPLSDVLQMAGVLPADGAEQRTFSPESQYLLERFDGLTDNERDLVLDFMEMLEMRRGK